MSQDSDKKRKIETRGGSGSGKIAGKNPGEHAKRTGRVIKLEKGELQDSLQKQPVSPEDVIFALDIGTRTIAGVVGVQEDKYFRVIATEVYEHKSRAMLDGQIHDVEQVAIGAAIVKKKLEERIGFELKRVAIAAAGRVLKTCQVKVEKELEQGTEIDAELVRSLEIEGIQRAQMMLDEEMAKDEKTQFYCVGYSVVNYYLDGFAISKLVGHKGRSIGANLLATFLPLIVVDSLYSVVNKIGLEVASLTLEPIAAINVIIPPDLRLLNLALVDIGAGTSDIAITKEGSVIAYAMVPIAGDELTEKISQHYLVDFNMGEKIKTSLSSGKDTISFTDILKKKRSVQTSDVLKAIDEPLQLLASTIAGKILEYNNKAPNAVFLVGGGSRIPGIARLIAQKLGLPEERVAIRGRDVIQDVKFCDKKLYGPESITPYGIALTAQMYAGKDFLTVTVNERKVKLFNTKKLTIADALILYGYNAEDLIGRSGRGITFSVNGEARRVRGEHGKAAEIYLNGKPAGIDSPIANGDNITVVPAVNGKDAVVKAGELVSDYYTGTVKLNGKPVDISTMILINGEWASRDTQVKDGDVVKISRIKTLRDLLEAGGYGVDGYDVAVNGKRGYDLDYVLNDKDFIECVEAKEPEDAGAAQSSAQYVENVKDLQDENLQNVQNVQNDVSKLEEDYSGEIVTVNGKEVVLKKSKSKHIFVDIFNYIDFDLSRPQGTIVLKLNGRPAAFTDTITSGDIIEIFWKK